MKEIEERKHVYQCGRAHYRWRGGKLEIVDASAGRWLESRRHDDFMRGVFPLLDPLDGEFVGPPKAERPSARQMAEG
jgi:hypothetical protein